MFQHVEQRNTANILRTAVGSLPIFSLFPRTYDGRSVQTNYDHVSLHTQILYSLAAPSKESRNYTSLPARI